ncbi:uncharacterized protein [Periplaneta americana]|uniref:uncharacterized protein n=1 Tax=Periplaneta americana TaxID=6978 RepID=UPI0037E87340
MIISTLHQRFIIVFAITAAVNGFYFREGLSSDNEVAAPNVVVVPVSNADTNPVATGKIATLTENHPGVENSAPENADHTDLLKVAAHASDAASSANIAASATHVAAAAASSVGEARCAQVARVCEKAASDADKAAEDARSAATKCLGIATRMSYPSDPNHGRRVFEYPPSLFEGGWINRGGLSGNEGFQEFEGQNFRFN